MNLISTKESPRPLVEGSLGVWGDGSGGPQTEKDLVAGKLWEPRVPPQKQPRSLCQGPPTHLRAATHTGLLHPALRTRVANTPVSLADPGNARRRWGHGLVYPHQLVPFQGGGRPIPGVEQETTSSHFAPPGEAVQQPGSGDGSPARQPEQKGGEPWSVRWWDLGQG